MNKAIIMGRLVRDADIRWSQGEEQLCIARFTLAVDRRYKKSNDDKTADFISCIAFGRIAEFMEKFGHKGVKFVTEGRIQTGSYTNRDGQKVYTTDIVVEQIEFAESKNSSLQNSMVQQEQDQDQKQSLKEDQNGFMMIPEGIDDELPFN
jgi:single-strand DNA-binding protein